MTASRPARTYNQSHTPREHTGGRRISIYWTWSYPWEAQRDPASMENRFSTITEVRNVLWPGFRGRLVQVLRECDHSSAPSRIRLAQLYVGSDQVVDTEIVIAAAKDAILLSDLPLG